MSRRTPSDAAPITGPIVLQVPADPLMARVVRLTASSLASLAHLSVDDIDDVKIVVSEVMATLIEHGDGDDVTLKFEIGEQHLEITGYTAASRFEVANDDLGLTVTVLAAIATEHSIQHADGQLLIGARYDAGSLSVPDAVDSV